LKRLAGAQMIEVDNKLYLGNALRKNEKVIVLFYASWCPYCVRFLPVFDSKAADFVFGSTLHVILDDYDNSLWDDYNIEVVPTVIYFEKGKINRRLDGRFGVGLNEKQFRLWLQEFNGS
jgi:thioredoxin 1